MRAIRARRPSSRRRSIGSPRSAPSLDAPWRTRWRTNGLNNPKELRPGSRGRPEIRIIFIFDPDREAVFLVAGDKTGKWARRGDDQCRPTLRQGRLRSAEPIRPVRGRCHPVGHSDMRRDQAARQQRESPQGREEHRNHGIHREHDHPVRRPRGVSSTMAESPKSATILS
ncbi:type II toxin-antitoxin system RelE/ParE family toxin [Streptosporangium sp. NPDC023615]|uniref:type II toxin-antitoxin system RelE/ParE family toxin n=1 Tax=Streptosporangium sp. NPDC023615 TaxID=3154794 RepID=UPI00341D34D8